MADNWYYTRGGQQVGPVSQADLQQAIATGQVSPQDLVWRDGMGEWQPAASVPGLVGGGGGPAPYVAPPQGMVPVAAPYGGAQPVGYASAATGQDHSGKAIGSLVCGILSLLICGIILGPTAIVLGNQAKAAMDQSGNQKGRGMATAGVIIGIIGVVGWAIVLILRFALR